MALLVAGGYLKGTHRTSRRAPEPLAAGEVYELIAPENSEHCVSGRGHDRLQDGCEHAEPAPSATHGGAPLTRERSRRSATTP